MKTDRLSQAEQLVLDRYKKTKALTEEFLAANHGGKADAQFSAVVRAFLDVIEGVRGVHRLEVLAPPKQGRISRYVN